jgi:prepilin-type N-terminal cleavage/methylation domain-containing protein
MIAAQKSRQLGVTLVELIVVLAIIGTLLALLLPAVQAARERARETVCKNNLHQLNLAIVGYYEIHKKLPAPSQPGRIGGWAIEVLPFIEQKTLGDSMQSGSGLETATELQLRQPRIMRCPKRDDADDVAEGKMHPTHYVFVPRNRRQNYLIADAPERLNAPWANGPELRREELRQAIGPHQGRLFFASGFSQSVGTMLKGDVVQ